MSAGLAHFHLTPFVGTVELANPEAPAPFRDGVLAGKPRMSTSFVNKRRAREKRIAKHT
jgi:hypothetical protein